MLSSHNHFDRLKTCVVGRSYSPEFYKWIHNPKLRSLFERIAIETEEDYQALVKLLESFDVEVIRPIIPDDLEFDTKGHQRIPGPYSMTPRDEFSMIGNVLYVYNTTAHIAKASGRLDHVDEGYHFTDKYFFDNVLEFVKRTNRVVTPNNLKFLDKVKANGLYRLGTKLIFGLDDQAWPTHLATKFFNGMGYEVDWVHSNGHVDGCMSIPKPGLILSVTDMEEDYNKMYPDWEVVYLENQGWKNAKEWNTMKKATQGRWWIPNANIDDELITFVETWLKDWVGYCEETVFDVNVLSIDQKNIIVSGYNKQAFDAFERHGITPHITPWRHRNFWDGGIHCITLDLHREGDRIDYFKDK